MDLRIQLTICPMSQTLLPNYTINIVFLFILRFQDQTKFHLLLWLSQYLAEHVLFHSFYIYFILPYLVSVKLFDLYDLYINNNDLYYYLYLFPNKFYICENREHNFYFFA